MVCVNITVINIDISDIAPTDNITAALFFCIACTCSLIVTGINNYLFETAGLSY